MIPGTDQIHVLLDAESLNVSQKSVITGLGWWRRKHDSAVTKAAGEQIATEVYSEQRHDRVVISSYPKVVDREDRKDCIGSG